MVIFETIFGAIAFVWRAASEIGHAKRRREYGHHDRSRPRITAILEAAPHFHICGIVQAERLLALLAACRRADSGAAHFHLWQRAVARRKHGTPHFPHIPPTLHGSITTLHLGHAGATARSQFWRRFPTVQSLGMPSLSLSPRVLPPVAMLPAVSWAKLLPANVFL